MRATMTAGNPARQYDIADHLFFKLQGATPGALSESVEVVKKIVKKHGGDKFWPARTQEEAEAVWTDRKNGLYSSQAYAGEGARVWMTDVWCVQSIITPARMREGLLSSVAHVTLSRGNAHFEGCTVFPYPGSRNSCTRHDKTSHALAFCILSSATQGMVNSRSCKELWRKLESVGEG